MRIWNHAATTLRINSLDSTESLGDVAELAASLTRRHRSMRVTFLIVRRELARLGYERDRLDDAAHLALGLRLADIAGAKLSAGLTHIAKYGSDSAPVPDYPYVLYSEKLRCISTVTLREAYLYRAWIVNLAELGEYPIELYESASLLDLVIVELANNRAAEPPFYETGQPLGEVALLNIERAVVELQAQARESTGGVDQSREQLTLF